MTGKISLTYCVIRQRRWGGRSTGQWLEIRWLGEINVELGDLEGRLCSCGKKNTGFI